MQPFAHAPLTSKRELPELLSPGTASALPYAGVCLP